MVWVVAKSEIRKDAPLLLSYGIGSWAMGSDGSNRERDRGSIGGKEKPRWSQRSPLHMKQCDTTKQRTMRSVRSFFYDNWTSPAALLNTYRDGKDNCTILKVGPKNKKSKMVWVVAKSEIREGAPLLLSYGIGSWAMGSDGSNRERDRGSIGGKEKPSIKTQSTAHMIQCDTTKQRKMRSVRSFFRVRAAAITKRWPVCCFEQMATMEHKTKAACIKQKQTTSMRIICAAMFGLWCCWFVHKTRISLRFIVRVVCAGLILILITKNQQNFSKPSNPNTVNPSCGAGMWRKLLRLLLKLIRQYLN